MLVWDAPVIMQGMASLRSSRLSPIYNEVAPVIGVFGKLFGKALEAQVRRGDWGRGRGTESEGRGGTRARGMAQGARGAGEAGGLGEREGGGG